MEIEELVARNGESSAAVLAEAFREYPFLSRVFEGAAKPAGSMLLELFRLSIETRLATRFAGLAATDRGAVVGVATVVVPDPASMPQEIVGKWDALESGLSASGRALFQEYDSVQERARPKEPHLYVAAVGVLPGHQGKGVGRALLGEVQRYAGVMGLAGVGLDTHAPENVAKYQSLGFSLLSKQDILGMPNWYFWNQAKRGS